MSWKKLGDGNPQEYQEYFLVRVRGEHRGRGGPCAPLVVQMIDCKLYLVDNEIEPIIFSTAEDFLTPSDDPMLCNLEWHPIPEGKS